MLDVPPALVFAGGVAIGAVVAANAVRYNIDPRTSKIRRSCISICLAGVAVDHPGRHSF